MAISDIRGEQTLDVIADLIPPISRIAKDKEVMGLFTSGGEGEGKELVASRLGTAVPALIKSHREDVIEILAAVNCTPVEEYKAELTIPKLLADTYAVMTDKDLLSFFG